MNIRLPSNPLEGHTPEKAALSYRFYGNPSDELSESTPQEIVDPGAVGCGSELPRSASKRKDCRLRVKLAVGRILETMEEDCE